MALSASWISKKASRCGGDACIRETRIPVWTLVERRHQGETDEEILASLPSLTGDDLAAAWEYFAAYQNEIERSLWENEASMIEHDGWNVPETMLIRGRQLGLSDEAIRDAFEPPLSQARLEAALTRNEAG